MLAFFRLKVHLMALPVSSKLDLIVHEHYRTTSINA